MNNFVKNIVPGILIYTVLFSSMGLSLYWILSSPPSPVVGYNNFSQPKLPAGVPWPIKSIDTQIVSKHWVDLPPDRLKEQVAMLSALNPTYIAVATPYDRPEELKAWVDEIHAQGMKVWFRSHWAAWEGDDHSVASMSPSDYLIKTEEFIVKYPHLFREGDAFTTVVEPEQAGVGPGRKFADWKQYKKFVLDSVLVANKSFERINKGGTIHTNWVSVNGWVAENVFDDEMMEKLEILVVDHYPVQTETIGEKDDLVQMVANFSADLDRMHAKFNKPIILGEWGYQIHQEIDNETQTEAIRLVYEMLVTKPYVVGVNYWAHMGNTARLIDDNSGRDFTYRPAAEVIRQFFAGNVDAFSMN